MKIMNVGVLLGALALVIAGCGGSHPTAPGYSGAGSGGRYQGVASRVGSVKGAAGQMPAYYDGELVTINSMEVSETAGDQIASNPSHNDIFVTNDLDDEQDFVPVIDAIPGDGFNPLWEQIRIVFNPGVTPHQFLSDEEVEAAAAGQHPEITLVDTHEVYRCSVVAR
jgi:hypothetical protein